jgi:hypothetical protein
VPPFKPTVEAFKSIPVGETDMDLDVKSLKMPDTSTAVYNDEHITGNQEGGHLPGYRERPIIKQPEPRQPEQPQPKPVEPKRV